MQLARGRAALDKDYLAYACAPKTRNVPCLSVAVAFDGMLEY